MARIIKSIKAKPRYIIFETGALNPKKITRVTLVEAKRVAASILSKPRRKGRRVVIQKIQNILEE